jgi:hypothetical protein
VSTPKSKQRHGQRQGHVKRWEDAKYSAKVKIAQTNTLVLRKFETQQRGDQEAAEQKEDSNPEAARKYATEASVSEEYDEK